MSYHILHVFQHGSTLAKDRGHIVCRDTEGQEKKMPHMDVRAVVIAARGVTLTSNFMSTITSGDGIILHCDEKYQPCGVTTPLSRVTDVNAYMTQARQPIRLNGALWNRILRYKTLNQQNVLHKQDLDSPHLQRALSTRGQIDEGNCARRYWQLYFPSIGYTGTKRERKMDNLPNMMLNYGYTVLGALCHRSLIIHGLSPLLGVKHRSRYRAHPLVYDIMEPYRPCVDLMLAKFLLTDDISMRTWSKTIGQGLKEWRVHHERYSLKLMDAVDMSARSLSASYRDKTVEPLWFPEI